MLGVGSEVTVSEGYDVVGDAFKGPLKKGDQGVMVKCELDQKKPYLVRATTGARVGLTKMSNFFE